MLGFDVAMAVSGVVMMASFGCSFTGKMLGLDRAKFGLAGAVAIILAGQATGFYGTERALEAVHESLIQLLFMITIVAIMLPIGGFKRLALRIGELRIGRTTRLFPDCPGYRSRGQGSSTSGGLERTFEMGAISYGGRSDNRTDHRSNGEA